MGKHHSAESAERHWPRLLLTGFLIIVGVLTIIGVAREWPSSDPVNVAPEFTRTFSLNQEQVRGHIDLVEEGTCGSPSVGQAFDEGPVDPLETRDDTCQRAIVTIEEGPDAGKHTLLISSGMPGDPEFAQDTDIMMSTSGGSYAFSDNHRSASLAVWLILIAAAIIAFAAWRGVRALLGLILTLTIVVVFLLPALLRGGSGLSLAIVTGSLILYAVLFLVHGVSWKTASALGGTLVALGISGLIAHWMIHSTSVRGLGSEDNLKILLYLPDVSVRGLMLCGFIIGALGVLNDVTIAQSSTVNELAALNPDSSPWRLFVGAMRVGRDHIASMIYTLVLSYTGATLPLLLLIRLSDRPLGQILTSDIVATEILRSGIGALALTLAVPLTTAIAALTVPTRAPATPRAATPPRSTRSARR